MVKNSLTAMTTTVVAATLLLATAAWAADGELGALSEVSIELSATIPEIYQLVLEKDSLEFDDITDFNAEQSVATGFCVRSTAGPNYTLRISAVSDDPNNRSVPFSLQRSGGGDDSIVFLVTVNEGSGAQAMTPGQGRKLTQAKRFSGCSGARESGELKYTLGKEDLLAAPAGVYKATSYITVSAS